MVPTSLTQLPMKNITIIAMIKKIKHPLAPVASGSKKFTRAKAITRTKKCDKYIHDKTPFLYDSLLIYL